jgi:hypothetical protein
MDNEINSNSSIVTTNPAEIEIKNAASLAFMNPADIPDLDEMDAGTSLRMQYKEFDKEGEKVRCIFVGMTKMPGQRGEIDAAVFQTKLKGFINAGANLMSQVKMLKPGTPIEIEYEGKERTASGNTVKVFNVRVLTLR